MTSKNDIKNAIESAANGLHKTAGSMIKAFKQIMAATQASLERQQQQLLRQNATLKANKQQDNNRGPGSTPPSLGR